jgi:D-beta-D-heptose 7-phosphate kinase/D-beta-D-heptose 1-phosphate adenosyltransferase
VGLQDQFASSRVLVIGDVALDCYVYGDVIRISPEAPVPVLRIHSTRDAPGCAANVAANVAALGAQATLIGLTGTDAAAAQLAATMHGISQALTIADPNRPTTIKTRYIASGQQIVRADQETTQPPGSATEDRILEMFTAALEANDVVAISDYNKGMLTDRILRSIIDAARAAGKPVIVDPKRLTFASYRGATIVKPNRSELVAATGLPCQTDDEARIAAQAAIDATSAMILLTRSEQGMSLFQPGAAPVHCRTEARDVFDVSGAGDTVAAVMAVALAAGIDPLEAMRLSNAAAGLVVGKRGTATVTAAELSEALAKSQRGFESRVISRDAAIRQRDAWRRQGLSCGFTNGCFDLIHPGHISLLKRAKASCDRLIVALNSDNSVRRLKGPSRPLQDQNARAYVMAHIEQVDGVILFDEDTPLELINALKPDVLIKGADYREDQVVGADLVKSWGGRVVLANLLPEQSTTKLARRASELTFN